MDCTSTTHVPPKLVRDWTLEEAGRSACPLAAMDAHRDGPPITFAPHGRRGQPTWVVNNYAMIVEILQTPDLFSSDRYSGTSRLLGENWPMIPLEVDAPLHRPFRALLNKVFAPRRMDEIEGEIAAALDGIIDRVLPLGGCDFQEAVGRPLPTSVFLQLLGLPLEDTPTLLAWERQLMIGATPAERIAGIRGIKDYLVREIADREAAPRDDIISYVAGAEIDDRALTADEKLGICFVLYGAGLDTVAASLGAMFKYLAEHPDRQKMLRDTPELRTRAVEEMLRAHSSITTGRILTRDIKFHGVAMKKGDFISLPSLFANRDPDQFPDPAEVDFERANVMRHVAFGSGPHACLGSHLARRELRIVLDAWMERVPPFRIAEGKQAVTYGGTIFGVDSLPLSW